MVDDLIPLRQALYGPTGLFPEIRLRDVRQGALGPVTRLRSQYWRGAREFVHRDAVERARTGI